MQITILDVCPNTPKFLKARIRNNSSMTAESSAVALVSRVAPMKWGCAESKTTGPKALNRGLGGGCV